MEGKNKAVSIAARAAKSQDTVIRRASNRIYGVFIDGVGLDRACRRMQKKVDMAALLKSLTAGSKAQIARYYTLLPNEDDSRHRAFLEAVSKAGLEVLTKRLPPKGIDRQITTDAEMGADIVSFALARNDIADVSLVSASGQFSIMRTTDYIQSKAPPSRASISPHPAQKLSEMADLDLSKDFEIANEAQSPAQAEAVKSDTKRVIVVVCPSRDLAYPLALCNHFGADTISADFAKFTGGDIFKSAAKWIDLSDSQTIWK